MCHKNTHINKTTFFKYNTRYFIGQALKIPFSFSGGWKNTFTSAFRTIYIGIIDFLLVYDIDWYMVYNGPFIANPLCGELVFNSPEKILTK